MLRLLAALLLFLFWVGAVHAAVRLTPDVRADSDELIAFVKRELGSVKAPKAIHFVTELPRNAAGKVSRDGVRRLVSSR